MLFVSNLRILNLLYTTPQKFEVSKFVNTFIQQGCITLIKSVSKDIYNVTKDLIANNPEK